MTLILSLSVCLPAYLSIVSQILQVSDLEGLSYTLVQKKVAMEIGRKHFKAFAFHGTETYNVLAWTKKHTCVSRLSFHI